MNAAAQHVLRVLPDIILGYGHSDEYSFVFHRSCTLFERRSAKIASTVVSTFTSAYVHLWPSHFASQPDDGTYFRNPKELSNEEVVQKNEAIRDSELDSGQLDLTYLPTFDARCVAYPSDQNLRDYISWRQADCHINNLYNTTFWALVLKGEMSNTEAEEYLKGTLSSDKNEILWARFGTNYNNERDIFRKGSIVLREYELEQISQSDGIVTEVGQSNDEPNFEVKGLSKTQQEKVKKARQKAKVIVQHVDVIKDEFWKMRPWLLTGGVGRPKS